MTKSLLNAMLACVVFGMSPGLYADAPITLTPEVTSSGVRWEGRGITILHQRSCRSIHWELWPETKCSADYIRVEPDFSITEYPYEFMSRKAQQSDLVATAYGRQFQGYSVDFGTGLFATLTRHADTAAVVTVGERVGPNPVLPSTGTAYALADFRKVTSQYSQKAYDQAHRETQLRQALVVFGIIGGVMGAGFLFLKLRPVVRKGMTAGRIMSSRARASAGQAVSDRKLKKEVKRLQLEEEADRLRSSRQRKEQLNEAAMKALAEGDYEKAGKLIGEIELLRNAASDGERR